MEVLKKYKVLFIVLAVTVVVLIAMVCAVGIVNYSYSSEEYVVEKEGISDEEEIAAPSVEDDFQMEFDESSDGEHAKVLQMYNEDRVESDFEKLMEDSEIDDEDRSRLEAVIDEITENASEFFEDFPMRDSDDPIEAEPEYYDFQENPDLTAKDVLMDSDYSIIRNSLTVIGLFDNNKVLYAYGFPESTLLVCIDYADTMFLEETDEVWRIGDVKDVAIDSEFATMMEAGGYTIIFARG